MRLPTTAKKVVINRSCSEGSRGSLRGDGRLLCTIPLFRPAIFKPNSKKTRTGERKGRYQTSNQRVLH